MSDCPTIVTDDFKDQFPREFPYLSGVFWVSTKTYATGQKVYQEDNETFYKAKSENSDKKPSDNPAEWEVYDDDELNYIIDADIERAFREATISFREGLTESCEERQDFDLYLSAHYLALDIRNALQGVNSSAPTTVSARSVGSVSESYAIPEAWTKSAVLSFYTTTYFGLNYLSFVYPRMIGNVIAVAGATTP